MLYLISQSPQRRDILNELELEFCISPADCEEITAETPEETVRQNACLKAIAACGSKDIPAGSLILAADTVVESNGIILGKPADAGQAAEYLRQLSGRKITVWSAVSIIRIGENHGLAAVESAGAEIKNLSIEEINWYVKTGEPLSRAGAFGISRRGEIFVKELYGSYSCFAGLPKRTLCMLLAAYKEKGFEYLPFTQTEKSNICHFTLPAGAQK